LNGNYGVRSALYPSYFRSIALLFGGDDGPRRGGLGGGFAVCDGVAYAKGNQASVVAGKAATGSVCDEYTPRSM
jgi:hypothetical protein